MTLYSFTYPPTHFMSTDTADNASLLVRTSDDRCFLPSFLPSFFSYIPSIRKREVMVLLFFFFFFNAML